MYLASRPIGILSLQQSFVSGGTKLEIYMAIYPGLMLFALANHIPLQRSLENEGGAELGGGRWDIVLAGVRRRPEVT